MYWEVGIIKDVELDVAGDSICRYLALDRERWKFISKTVLKAQ